MIENPGALGAKDNVCASARTDQRQHLALLDDWRGIAILLVFFGHCENALPQSLGGMFDHPWDFLSAAFSHGFDLHALALFVAFYPLHLGWCGVAIFFVVSGFCIHLSYSQTTPRSFTTFYIRRFFRIYPPYLLAVLFFAILFPWTRLSLTKLTYWGQLATHLLLCHNVSDFFVWSIAAPYWSIAVEAQLYVLFPVVLVCVRRSSFRRTLILLAVVEFSLHALSVIVFEGSGQVTPAWLRASPFFYWFSWTIGAALGDAYLRNAALPFTRVNPLFWLAAAVSTSSWRAHEFSFSFFALFTAAIIARSLTPGSKLRPSWFLGRLVRQTGIYSYSIYLIHEPIIRAVVSVYKAHFPGIETHAFVMFLAGASSGLIVFPLSVLLYRWVEKPGISLGKRLIRLWAQRSEQHIHLADVTASS
jgi:peptidoglycan/LPS O-acetylase OafA/YrhL